MIRSVPAATDTRLRILDAAEELFSEFGFRTVSLRRITVAAGVNLAAVNYHFGSKDALVDEVLTRVIQPINRRRLELLDEAESTHGEQPAPLEEILVALHRPVVDQMTESNHRSPVYLRLAGRCLSEPAEKHSERLAMLFAEMIRRFLAALRRTLPHLDESEIFWRMHLSFGTMIFALTHEDRLRHFSQGRVEAKDPEDTLRRLIHFTAAGLRAEHSATSLPTKARGVASILAVAAALFLSPACSHFSPPDATHYASLSAPAHWIAGPHDQALCYPDKHWVEHFGDKDLSAFVESVLTNNRDLKAASARLEVAQANARITGADLYPQISGNFSGQRTLQNFIGFPLGNAPPNTILSSRSNRFGLSLDLSWELDLWGKIRAAQKAAVADFEASGFDRATAELSLTGQATKAWFALAEARDQAELSRRTIMLFDDTARLINERFSGGLEREGQSVASQLLLAQADVATARESLASQLDLVGRTARQLEVLAGEYPAGVAGKTAQLRSFPKELPLDLPATLLDRRPDLAAAERRIAAADQRLLEAKRMLLPSIGLTSSFGTSTEDISQLLSGDVSVWSIAGNLAQPILQGGRIRANITRRDAEIELAAAEFEQAALTAFAEVENCLAAEAFYNTRVAALTESARLTRAAYRRSLEEFQNGTGDILTVLTAQQRIFSSESQLLSLRRLRLTNRVDLYLALGGSFRPCEPPLDQKEPQI